MIVGGDRGTTTRVALDQEALADLDAVPADGEVHDVRVDGLGSFRVAVEPAGDLAVGLPTETSTAP